MSSRCLYFSLPTFDFLAKYEEVEEMLPPFSHFYGNPSGIYTNLDQMLNYERFVIEEYDFGSFVDI